MRVAIDSGLKFSDLQMTRDPVTGDFEMDELVIQRILDDSRIDSGLVTEEMISAILVAWYQHHRQHGGATDPVMEILLAEIEAENMTGMINIVSTGSIQ